MKRAVYVRANKPMRIPIKHRDGFDKLEPIQVVEPVIVDKFTECHVTPDDVASRMVAYLGPTGDFLTLEPSAGTGQLSKALLASGHSRHELTQVERHTKLASGLHRFGPVINRCFLKWAAEVKGRVEYPRIIMNPPFSQVRKHVAAALTLLGRGGHEASAVLVALVPITFVHSDAETLEILSADTFATAKVNTKIIRITKPN
ncbi:methyltransferase type 11 [Mesorhizobium sp. WSM4887]|uniref:methyltransferase type 11 n=1 Tax=Mesorhizobium sp. WSM4887 TaxID=3038543 RepID=UPI002417C6E3|nr:methyltransferase type 11 [Mesorhizobium sp. WSM4887]MDG4889705.1 methyltransferase type 11 [Mesorhizobium sp. WSM4887]